LGSLALLGLFCCIYISIYQILHRVDAYQLYIVYFTVCIDCTPNYEYHNGGAALLSCGRFSTLFFCEGFIFPPLFFFFLPLLSPLFFTRRINKKTK
jgi:hypothetical protein